MKEVLDMDHGKNDLDDRAADKFNQCYLKTHSVEKLMQPM